jgi:D-glycero-alpha-D-manno-heptose 1-phosphate guanylyltransferase
MTDTAIILAGGLGTRLRGVIGEVPKPLAPVQGRPFIAWQLDMLAVQGITTVVLATGYRAAMFREALGECWQGMCLVHAPEPEPLGTGGAIAHAAQVSGAGPALVVNGDTFLRLDIQALCRGMQQADAWCGIALVQAADAARYGAVRVHDRRIVALDEKGRQGPGLINGGWYWLNAQALQALPLGRACSFERDVLPGWLDQQRVLAYTDAEDFIDIGVPGDYATAQRRALASMPLPDDTRNIPTGERA